MANTITKTTLHDGQKNAVTHTYLLSDGSAGDITDNVVVDASGLSPAPSTVRIMKIWWSFSGFTAYAILEIVEWVNRPESLDAANEPVSGMSVPSKPFEAIEEEDEF